jgi:hypothetical protein
MSDQRKDLQGWKHPRTSEIVNFMFVKLGMSHEDAAKVCREAAEFFEEALRLCSVDGCHQAICGHSGEREG